MKKLDHFFLGAGIIFLPFIFSTEIEGMRAPKAHFLALLCGLYLACKLAQKVSLPLGCAAALLFTYGEYFSMGFQSGALLTLGAALASCLLFAEAQEDDVKRCLEYLEISGLLCAAYAMLLQLPQHDPILRWSATGDITKVVAFFGQHTLYGPFAVACFASALFRRHHFRALLLVLPALQICSSFTMLALSTVLALYAIYTLGKWALPALLLCALLGAATATHSPSIRNEISSDNGRFDLWRISYRVARVRPVFGHGFGAFAQGFQIFQDPKLRAAAGIDDSRLSKEAQGVIKAAQFLMREHGRFLSAHNILIDIFYDYGALGLFTLAWLIASFVFFWLLAPDTPEVWALGAIFFSFLANSLGNFPYLLIPQVLLPLFAFTAVTSWRNEDKIEA